MMVDNSSCVLCGGRMDKVKERFLSDKVHWAFYRCTGCDNQLWIPLSAPRVAVVQLPFSDILFGSEAVSVSSVGVYA